MSVPFLQKCFSQITSRFTTFWTPIFTKNKRPYFHIYQSIFSYLLFISWSWSYLNIFFSDAVHVFDKLADSLFTFKDSLFTTVESLFTLVFTFIIFVFILQSFFHKGLFSFYVSFLKTLLFLSPWFVYENFIWNVSPPKFQAQK